VGNFTESSSSNCLLQWLDFYILSPPLETVEILLAWCFHCVGGTRPTEVLIGAHSRVLPCRERMTTGLWLMVGYLSW